MPLDPAAQPILELMADALRIEEDATPEQVRAAMNAATSSELIPKQPVFDVADRVLPGPDGPIPVRIYRPSNADALPVLVWYHGGGWVIGNLDTHDQLCRLLCDATGALVVSVDYRLAPEHKFPAAVDDAVAAYEWAIRDGGEIGGDTTRVAIGGDSAGGNLAAVVPLVARERNLPMPRLHALVYPVTEHEFDSPSMIDNAKGYGLETEHMDWFFDHYARTSADFDDWRLSPMRASDLSGLPPALVVTAEMDPLRDQGEAYARRLAGAGVDTEIVRANGLFHGFFGLHAFVPPAEAVWERATSAVREAWGIDD
jgi:acetyl esterase